MLKAQLREGYNFSPLVTIITATRASASNSPCAFLKSKTLNPNQGLQCIFSGQVPKKTFDVLEFVPEKTFFNVFVHCAKVRIRSYGHSMYQRS